MIVPFCPLPAADDIRDALPRAAHDIVEGNLPNPNSSRMKIYQIRASAEYHSMIAADISRHARDELAHAVFRGESLSSIWSSIECRCLDPELGFGSFADFNILAALPVVFEQTLLKAPGLRVYFEEAGELLPLQVDGREAFVINITRVVDAIDHSASRLRRMSNGHEVSEFPVFQKVKCPVSGFFRIKEAWSRLHFVEPECGGFKELYENKGLTALVFKEQPLS